MAVFGVESLHMVARGGFTGHGTVCLDDPSFWRAGTFHGVHNGDLIFIKAYTPQTGLDVKAVGMVMSDFLSSDGCCIPVDWLWAGERHVSDVDDRDALRAKALYEEYNLAVQREILDLLSPEQRLAPP